MKTQRTYWAAFLFLFLFSMFGSMALAGIDWDVYFGGRRPTAREAPAEGQQPWTKVKDASKPSGTFTVTLTRNGLFFLGIPNIENTDWQKVLTIVISGTGCDDLEADQAVGHYGANGKKTTKGTIFKPSPDEENKYPGCKIIKVYYPVQPGWEWVRIKNTGSGGNFTFTIQQAYTNCNERGKTPPYYECYYESGYFGGTDNMVGPMAITELWNFPREAAVDVGVPPTFIADPATGNWTADFVYADPDGEPRPQGGVRFSSDGAGLAGGDEYYYKFTMLENWENEYTLYFFDAVEGEYYPLFAHTYPIIRSWQSIRYHGIEPYAIDLNTGFDSNGEYGPAVETRQGGIRKIQVEFDRAVTLLDPSSITISNGIDSFSPDTVMLENYDSLLVMTFSGSLPEQSCYTINLNEAIENLFGDSHCQVRSLIGDVSGDGIVNEEDEELMIENLGLSIEQDNAQYDLNLDGAISLLDLAILLDNFEALVFCEEPPSKYMIADISGPNGHPDYRVNLFDFMEIAAYWLECNDPFDASCDQ
jgi:hypothetical protein